MVFVKSELGVFRPEGNGKIDVQVETSQFEPSNKLPLCRLQVPVTINIQPGVIKNQINQDNQLLYEIRVHTLQLIYQNLVISEAFTTDMGIVLRPQFGVTPKFQLPLSYESLSYIERNRVDDVDLSLRFVGSYNVCSDWNEWKIVPDTGGNGINLHLAFQYSQKQWTDFLRKIGYGEKWIFEVERPKLQGFDAVLEKIQSAEEKLMKGQSSDPADILTDLRAAWDRFQPYLDTKFEEIKNSINDKSATESNQPSKSDRIVDIINLQRKLIDDIQDLQKRVDKLLQIGAHREIYVSAHRDALLSYRMTVSMMEYLSGLISENVRKEEAQMGKRA